MISRNKNILLSLESCFNVAFTKFISDT